MGNAEKIISTRKRVLLVDDEKDLLEILAEAFSQLDYEIQCAQSGEAAFALFKKHTHDFIITDIKMPNGDGHFLLQKIKDSGLQRPVIIVVSGHLEKTAAELNNMGANYFLHKPFKLDSLLKLVEQHQNNGQRRHKRFSNVSVDLFFSEETFFKESNVFNISMGGLFVALEERVATSDILLEFKLKIKKENDFLEFSGSAIVRWMHPNVSETLPRGIGLEFLRLSEGATTILQDFINQLEQQSVNQEV